VHPKKSESCILSHIFRSELEVKIAGRIPFHDVEIDRAAVRLNRFLESNYVNDLINTAVPAKSVLHHFPFNWGLPEKGNYIFMDAAQF